ncbi:hypothetical protein HBI24_136330 [Parastagonospora nodorum]|nr:hypothetical protein HBI71_071290 [Parastagonospora nodorum]KAH5425777.1 hypothetical protein HBI46_038580 [Parastagonospora nodorum]KAH5550326.1 hypothetical protein HBI27_019300 [Parastagonospora nodorum]KAH5581039.1 hypothetical protein HBI24_136330 [Parastagonospora nodorum]KAH6236336.1 hypothetical protein HBI43_005730 [Parastagonospora nodorum]
MNSLSALALLALSSCTIAVSTVDAIDFKNNMNPLMKATGPLRDPYRGKVVGRCNLGQLYCFNQIVYDLNYSIDDLTHQFCRDNPGMVGCSDCDLDGYKCLDKCLNAVFMCKDGIDQYKYQKSCMGEVHTMNSAGSLCIAGSCF